MGGKSRKTGGISKKLVEAIKRGDYDSYKKKGKKKKFEKNYGGFFFDKDEGGEL